MAETNDDYDMNSGQDDGELRFEVNPTTLMYGGLVDEGVIRLDANPSAIDLGSTHGMVTLNTIPSGITVDPDYGMVTSP